MAAGFLHCGANFLMNFSLSCFINPQFVLIYDYNKFCLQHNAHCCAPQGINNAKAVEKSEGNV